MQEDAIVAGKVFPALAQGSVCARMLPVQCLCLIQNINRVHNLEYENLYRTVARMMSVSFPADREMDYSGSGRRTRVHRPKKFLD